MQRIVRNGELFYGEQKANSHNSGKNGLKTIVVVVVVVGTHGNTVEMKKNRTNINIQVVLVPRHVFVTMPQV